MLLARLRRLAFFLVALAPSVCAGQDSVGGEPWANPADPLEILNRAAGMAAVLPCCQPREYLLREIARAQARAGAGPAGVKTLLSVPFEDTGEASGDVNREIAIVEIAVEWAIRGDAPGALTALERLTHAVLRQDGIARMVKALAGTGQTDAARPLIALLSDSRARAEAFADLAVGLGAAGRRAEAGAALADALRAARAIPAEGVPPDFPYSREVWHEGALTSVAVAQARLGAVPAALKTVGEIPGADFRRAHALSRVASVQAEAGDVAGALRTVSSLNALSSLSPEDPARIALNARLAIVRAQLRAGDLSGAIQLATETRSASARMILFETVAVRAGRSGARAEAAHAVRQALQVAAAPPGTRFPGGHVAAVSLAQARSGDIPGAIQTASAIGEEIYRHLALKDISKVQALAGDIEGAIRTARLISSDMFRTMALWGVVVLQAGAGDGVGALRTMQAVLPGPPDGQAVRAIARARVRGGAVAETLAWDMAQPSPELRVQGLLGAAEGLLANRGIAPPCLFAYTCARWLREPD